MRFKNNPFFWLIVGFLATWRITNIIQREEIASPVRKAVGIIEPDGEDPDHFIYPDNFLGKLFYCHWCMSVWVGTGITVLLFVFPLLIIPFALSALSIAFKKWIEQETVYIENYWTGSETEYGDLGEEDAGQ